MTAINDTVADESLETELVDDTETNHASGIVGIAAIAAVAAVSYFGFGWYFGSSVSKEQNDQNIADYLAVLEACDTPAQV
jgi:hypothetical protein